IFHRIFLRLLGIKIVVYGAPSAQSPVLFLSNHTSYLDIPVLGSILPASFVAKSEVASWPFFGFLAKVQNTVFVERRPVRAAEKRSQLEQHLAKQHDLILFPEGTSSAGLTVLPFKSTLFHILESPPAGLPITVQPVSVSCVARDGKPLSLADRDHYAWYDDM